MEKQQSTAIILRIAEGPDQGQVHDQAIERQGQGHDQQ
jgi:hypothetical protein